VRRPRSTSLSLEVEDLRVPRDAVAVGGLGNDGDAPLDAPTQEDLSWGSVLAVGDGLDDPVAAVCAGAQWAVCLECGAAVGAGVEERLAIGGGVEI